MENLCKQFLCCLPLHHIHFEEILKNMTLDDQAIFLSKTIHHPLVIEKPISLSYQIAFLKKIINWLTNSSIEIHDDIYTTYCLLMQKETSIDDFHYKHYKIFEDPSSIISLKESSHLISNGSTGLHTWEASIVLSEWLIQNSEILSDKVVLELGSGAGLAGLVAFKTCKLKQLWMSDYHEKVMSLIKENILLNHLPDRSSIVENEDTFKIEDENSKQCGVIKLLWEQVENYDSYNIPYPDIVIASDVVYDNSIFESLIKAFDFFLSSNKNCEIILVCTIRDSNTLDQFLELLRKNDKSISRITQPDPVYMCWPSKLNTVIYKIV